MQLLVNGQPHTLPDGSDLTDLLHVLGLGQRRVAVERNGQIVPRSEQALAVLADGDRIEIVQAIGGG